MEALDDLNVQGQPGSPGTDPSRSGGVPPVFRVEKGDNKLIWSVWNGDKVATKVTITLYPVDDGQHTVVRATAVRGDAPDEITAPAFRSPALTMSIFGMAIDEKLSAMTALRKPGSASPEFCRELFARLTGGSDGKFELGQEPRVKSGIGAIVDLHSAYPEMRRQGCIPDSNDDDFKIVSSEMR